MSAVSSSTFADRLRRLDRRDFAAFVAELWAASGWETGVEGSVVVARRAGEQRRLLAVPARRLARWRRAPAAECDVDRVVVACRIEDGEGLPRGTPDAPVVDADNLRRRLLYAVDADAGERICSETLGVPLRPDGRGTERRRVGRPAGALLVLVAAAALVALAVGALAAHGSHVPIGGESTATDEPDWADQDDLDPETTVRPTEEVATGSTVFLGSYDSPLFAVDAATGEQRWRFDDGPTAVAVSPTVDDGTVYVGDSGGTLYAVDAATGTSKWTTDEPGSPIYAAPTVAGEGEDRAVYVGANDASVYAFDAKTGQERWRFDDPTQGVYSSPTVVDGTLYVGDLDGTLFAVDAATGEQRWRFDATRRSIYAAPTVVGENGDRTVYIGTSGGTVIAVDADTGQERWRFDEPVEAVYSSVAVGGTEGESEEATGSVLYVASADGTLYAVDADTGDEHWRFDEPEAGIYAAPTVADAGAAWNGSTVYVGDGNATVYAVDAETGDRRWVHAGPEGERLRASPTVANGSVYVNAETPAAVALNASTGEREWAFTVPEGPSVAGPTVAADPVDGDSSGSRAVIGERGQEGTSEQAEPGLRLLDLSVPSAGDSGTQSAVRATITNPGHESRAGTVSILADGAVVDAAEVDLGAGESVVVTTWFVPPPGLDADDYSIRVETEGDERAIRAASHEIVAVAVPATAGPDARIEIDVEVANTGDRGGEVDLEITVDGTRVDAESPYVPVGETVTVTAEFQAESGTVPPDGERSVVVTTATDRYETGIEVVSDDGVPGFGLLVGILVVLGATILARNRDRS